MTLFYRFFRMIARILWLYYPVRTAGRENLPEEGPLLLVANHVIWYDPIPIAHAIKRQVFYMSKEENFQKPFFAWFLGRCGVFPVKRHSADLTAIRHGVKILKRGNVLGVFPEGTRNRTEDILQPFMEGAAMFARQTGGGTGGTVVIPVWLEKFRPFHRTWVVFGQPLDLTPWQGVTAREAMEGITQKMRTAVMELMRPPTTAN